MDSGIEQVKGIWISQRHWDQMLADVIDRYPNEACGLLSGVRNHSVQVFPLPNISKNPNRYRIDPREQLCVFNLLEDNGLDLLAIYHSHPFGPPIPSSTDIDEAAYPQAIHLIWGKKMGKWGCQGYLIDSNGVEKVEIYIVGASAPNGH